MASLSGSGQGRFYIIGNCISYYIKKASGRMRTRANKNYVASDRARRENVPRHILCSIFSLEFLQSFAVDGVYF